MVVKFEGTNHPFSYPKHLNLVAREKHFLVRWTTNPHPPKKLNGRFLILCHKACQLLLTGR